MSQENFTVFDYVESNLGVLEEVMRCLAQQRYRDACGFTGNDERLLFDPSRRALSEMEVCDFAIRLRWDIGYPPGHNLVRIGWVEIPSNPNIVKHMYFEKGDDIFCMTPGQFIRPNDLTMGKGERMAILQDRARESGSPDLVRQFSDEIWVLSGNRHEIAKKLKLVYR